MTPNPSETENSSAAGGSARTDGRASRSGRGVPSGPITLIILGASGDLTSRLLLPGLASLIAHRGAIDLTLIGAATTEVEGGSWQDLVRASLESGGVPAGEVDALVGRSEYVVGDVTDSDALRGLLERADPSAPVVLYFALPPAVTIAACRTLAGFDSLPSELRLALEKPFGDDEDSARELNRHLGMLVPEERIFRVDHFLGESMVLNMLTLRTANRVFGQIWDRASIERIEILADETLGLEGRAEYYDGAGALVDMLQSHLLQVLAFVAMEVPASLDERDVRAATAAVLRAVHVAGEDPIASSRRARYTAGSAGGKDLPDYAAEDGVDPSRGTETLAEVDLEIRSSRWAGVPILLRSGKALGEVRREVRVYLKNPDFVPVGLAAPAEPDLLVISLIPEHIALTFSVDGADTPFRATQRTLDISLAEPDIEPYGQVLSAVLSGNPLLSVRGDAAEESWRILDPVIRAWQADLVPLEEYEAGSQGPEGWRA